MTGAEVLALFAADIPDEAALDEEAMDAASVKEGEREREIMPKLEPTNMYAHQDVSNNSQDFMP